MSVPCLLVTDIQRAVAYYRETLGFESVELLEDPPVAAYVRRGSSTFLLQATDDPDAVVASISRRGLAGQAWDALILVDDIEGLTSELRSRGAKITVGLGVTPVSDYTLEVRDPWGNLLAFADAPLGLVRRVTEGAKGMVPTPVRQRARDLRSAREERAPAAALREFCADLDGQNPFYMYFTRDLLHWVRQAAAQVPADVTLALIGSDLPPHELEWLRERVNRPVHNIALGVDDNTTWEFLFDSHRFNFGWIDIDCFVLEPSLFTEMTRFDDDVAMNGMWCYDAAPATPITCSHFAFVNAAAVRTLRSFGDAMTPTNYDWTGSTISLLHPRSRCRIPDAAQERLLLKVLPPDDEGHPTPPGGTTFFDTLVCFQVGAYARGFRTNAIRPLAHRTQDDLVGATTGPVWQQDMSDEIVHVGAVSYYQRDFNAVGLRAMYVAAEYAMITAAGGDLPHSYATRRDQLVAQLAEYDLDPDEAVSMLRRHLVDDRGLTEATASRVLGTAITSDGHVEQTASTIPLPRLTPLQDALLRAAFRELMATSVAVPLGRLAELGGVAAADAEVELERLVAAGRVGRGEHGDVTGALGLTIEDSRHELIIGPDSWHTWCVIDALGILGALGLSGRVHSAVPGTDQQVEITFTEGRPDSGNPEFVVFVPDYVAGTPVIETWCPAVNFFPDVASAECWAADAAVGGHAVSLGVATAAATERWRSRLAG